MGCGWVWRMWDRCRERADGCGGGDGLSQKTIAYLPTPKPWPYHLPINRCEDPENTTKQIIFYTSAKCLGGLLGGLVPDGAPIAARNDAELATLVALWADLPAAVRAGLLALPTAAAAAMSPQPNGLLPS